MGRKSVLQMQLEKLQSVDKNYENSIYRQSLHDYDGKDQLLDSHEHNSEESTTDPIEDFLRDFENEDENFDEADATNNQRLAEEGKIQH